MAISGNDIRKKFLQYFESKGHTHVNSASLIPHNDPTLYFTNAGMVQFKNTFTGEEKRDYSRATTSQKCMRVSGKHNDLENVGRTARHHTFFEMLGNFSFGDYFKSEAIAFAWEFLTKEMQLPKEKLWITVFDDDDEAEKIWHEQEKIPMEKIKRMGEKDNFWSMGPTGPCGPCSEIHIEQDIPCGEGKSQEECKLGECECDRFLEIWNLVFMQFDRGEDGKMTPLPKPSIDTGMGLERLAAVIQGKHSNYDCDLFTPILESIQKITLKKYGADEEDDVSMRVLADHIRATVFLINDGVLPSNEGRGYVLRRIMRRAIRHGKRLGQERPFFYRLIEVVIREMKEAYPDLLENQTTIEKVILAEEERFFETLDKGLKILTEEMDVLKKENKKVLPGAISFKLYDTFGFPLDLTEIILQEHGFSVDHKGFDECMQEQKERARKGWKGTGQEKVQEVYFELENKFATKFLGYDTLEATAKVEAIIQNGALVDSVSDGECEIVFDQTPFYAEGGGQTGDKGFISGNVKAKITDTQKPTANVFIHSVKLESGTIKVGDQLQLQVTRNVRRATMRNHSATHLMHAALRKILGDHVRQSGSLVNSKILRFDFTHFEAIPVETLRQIEEEVNQAILENYPIEKEEMDQESAKQKGALAFFGDKYGDVVRVVSMGDYSVEFCGGTHLDVTSEIGSFKIISESSIAAGVRRIEAVTGYEAMKLSQTESQIVQDLTSKLKVKPEEIESRIEKYQSQIKSLEKDIEKLKAQALRGGAVDFLKDAVEVNGVKAAYHKADVEDAKGLQDIAIVILEKLGSGVAVVGAEVKGKASLLVMCTKDVTDKVQANKILQPLAELIGGRGGGKPERAQAGGTDVSGLDKIQSRLAEVL